MKALIVGGGIGGLTAALCLHQFGIEAEIYERSESPQESGAGIQISPNGMKVFRALGLEKPLAQLAFRPEAVEVQHGIKDTPIFRIPLGDTAKAKWGAPYYTLRRSDLLAVLAEAVKERLPVALHFGAKATGYTQTGQTAFLILDDGRQVSGTLLIGADGVHSTIRRQMHETHALPSATMFAWRGLIAAADLRAPVPPVSRVWIGAGRHAVVYPVGKGEFINFVGVVEHANAEGLAGTGNKQEALVDFAGWSPALCHLIENATNLHRQALFDSASLPSFVSGRVALLGDAAHPMLPFMAQGAVMAVEDGFILARCLAGGQPAEAALKSYSAIQQPRTGKAQAMARYNGRIFHRRAFWQRFTGYRFLALAGRFAPALLAARQNRLYGFDATQ